MTSEATQPSHWNAYAARFRLVGPPLRPGPTDIDYVRSSVRRLRSAATSQNRAALLLGVTSEIAEIDWTPELDLLAVDKSSGMVEGVWPGDTPHRRAIVGDWLSIERPAAGFGLVLGDGVFTLFDFPRGYARLGAALGDLLAPHGLLSLRLFCRPEPGESVDHVFSELWAGRIGNFHVFKWRLAMALQGDETRGVRLSDIWDTFERRARSPRDLAARVGFPEPEVSTIEGYRGVADRYSFSTEAELVHTLAPWFELLETWRPSYELGDRCPHLTFRRRAPPE